MMTRRLSCIALLCLAALAPWLQAQQSDLPFNFQKNVMVPMRDGTQLAANIFLPKDGGPHPVILIRTPYGKMDEKFGEARRYCAAGYVMVAQDCRGRGTSQGVWEPFRYDGDDGFDTQEWVGRHPPRPRASLAHPAADHPALKRREVRVPQRPFTSPGQQDFLPEFPTGRDACRTVRSQTLPLDQTAKAMTMRRARRLG